MKKNQINHNALTNLVEADAVSVVVARAEGDTWLLTVKVGDTLKIVMAKNSGKPRVWRKLDTLAKYLKDLGVQKFHTDVSNYDPSQKSLRRPDSANTLKKAHKSLKNTLADTQEQSEPLIDDIKPEAVLTVNVKPQEKPSVTDPVEVSEPTKINPTDKAIELAKERWESRRAKILKEENPRAK